MLEKQHNASDLLAFAVHLQRRHEAATSIVRRKERGQVFTPPAICRFMASLFSSFPKTFRLLDPGAGVGSLSAAVCERILDLTSPRSCDLHVFETDASLIPFLRESLHYCQVALAQAGHRLTYTIHQEDFLLRNPRTSGQPHLFEDENQLQDFDAVIMNPPYFKIGGTSRYARLMADVVHGQPNIYALFLAKAAEMIGLGGELVAITPRSFCNGMYFRGFRRHFFAHMTLRHIHLFESRKHTFKDADVLQESLITMSQRLDSPTPSITLSTSFGSDLPAQLDYHTFPSSRILDNSCKNLVVRIPASSEEMRIMEVVDSWPTRFADLRLRVSTGPVVLFRAERFLLDKPNGAHSAPLFLVHNVRPFSTVWPLERKSKPTAFLVSPESHRLLVPTRNYVFLRRFSAKEERRRLTASCYLRESKSPPYLALENHLNYVYHADRELSVEETYGLAALFNSALLDRYFRTISGNTQVNASEIRTMRFPDLETVAAIGRRIKMLRTLHREEVEKIVCEELRIEGAIRHYLTGSNL